MTLEQIVKQSQGEQYVYPDVFTDKCGLDISKHSASCVFFSPLFLPTFVASL